MSINSINVNLTIKNFHNLDKYLKRDFIDFISDKYELDDESALFIIESSNLIYQRKMQYHLTIFDNKITMEFSVFDDFDVLYDEEIWNFYSFNAEIEKTENLIIFTNVIIKKTRYVNDENMGNTYQSNDFSLIEKFLMIMMGDIFYDSFYYVTRNFNLRPLENKQIFDNLNSIADRGIYTSYLFSYEVNNFKSSTSFR